MDSVQFGNVIEITKFQRKDKLKVPIAINRKKMQFIQTQIMQLLKTASSVKFITKLLVDCISCRVINIYTDLNNGQNETTALDLPRQIDLTLFSVMNIALIKDILNQFQANVLDKAIRLIILKMLLVQKSGVFVARIISVLLINAYVFQIIRLLEDVQQAYMINLIMICLIQHAKLELAIFWIKIEIYVFLVSQQKQGIQQSIQNILIHRIKVQVAQLVLTTLIMRKMHLIYLTRTSSEFQ